MLSELNNKWALIFHFFFLLNHWSSLELVPRILLPPPPTGLLGYKFIQLKKFNSNSILEGWVCLNLDLRWKFYSVNMYPEVNLCFLYSHGPSWASSASYNWNILSKNSLICICTLVWIQVINASFPWIFSLILKWKKGD